MLLGQGHQYLCHVVVVKPFAKGRNITASFEIIGRGTVSYMHCQYTKMETKFMGLPIKMNQLTSVSEQELFDGLQKVVIHLRFLRIKGF